MGIEVERCGEEGNDTRPAVPTAIEWEGTPTVDRGRAAVLSAAVWRSDTGAGGVCGSGEERLDTERRGEEDARVWAIQTFGVKDGGIKARVEKRTGPSETKEEEDVTDRGRLPLVCRGRRHSDRSAERDDTRKGGCVRCLGTACGRLSLQRMMPSFNVPEEAVCVRVVPADGSEQERHERWTTVTVGRVAAQDLDRPPALPRGETRSLRVVYRFHSFSRWRSLLVCIFATEVVFSVFFTS